MFQTKKNSRKLGLAKPALNNYYKALEEHYSYLLEITSLIANLLEESDIVFDKNNLIQQIRNTFNKGCWNIGFELSLDGVRIIGFESDEEQEKYRQNLDSTVIVYTDGWITVTINRD